MSEEQTKTQPPASSSRKLIAVAAIAALTTAGVAALLVTIVDHKQEGRQPFLRAVEVNEISTDPQPWGINWPHQFDGWKATAGDRFDGSSSAMSESKLDKQPWLKRLYAGYAFSLDYREARGHAYMLYDQGVTERVTQKPQAGACLHCHGSTTVLYRKTGLEAMGQASDDAALSSDFNMPAMIKGFQTLSPKPYFEVLTALRSMPDGTPGENVPVFPQAPDGGFDAMMAGKPLPADHPAVVGEAHPVSCIDCHNPRDLTLRVSRPGFVLGIAALANSDEPTPHLPSIERWRKTARTRPYDPNVDASRQELRSFVCGQCHVEYYCGDKMTLTFPWADGLKVEQIEQVWERTTFADGSPFSDFTHGETGARVFKAQHPEFELWSQGIHARSGVSCADCHMPYERQGAMKLSSHNVRSPLAQVNNSCQTCHKVGEASLIERVRTIQQRTVVQTERAAAAMTDMLDAILQARAAGATDEQLAPALALQRKAMWRLDFISSENSKGFHADQEAMRILGESIDYSRQAQAIALKLRAGAPPDTSALPRVPIRGVTPSKGDAPVDAPAPTSPSPSPSPAAAEPAR